MGNDSYDDERDLGEPIPLWPVALVLTILALALIGLGTLIAWVLP